MTDTKRFHNYILRVLFLLFIFISCITEIINNTNRLNFLSNIIPVQEDNGFPPLLQLKILRQINYNGHQIIRPCFVC